MGRLVWDKSEERIFETGVSKGVLYPKGKEGYETGVVWNGLTAVNENPSGAEATPLYADNIKYLNLLSAEEFGATIEAYTYPDEFADCNGEASIAAGVTVGQQARKPFGMSYQTKVGNEDDPDAGYKIHLIYGAKAAPSQKSYGTVNETPEAITFSWEISTTPIEIPGMKPSASITIDSTKFTTESEKAKLKALEDILYGKDAKGEGETSTDPRLPTPQELVDIFNTAG